jgi:hypothetical protein
VLKLATEPWPAVKREAHDILHGERAAGQTIGRQPKARLANLEFLGHMESLIVAPNGDRGGSLGA